MCLCVYVCAAVTVSDSQSSWAAAGDQVIITLTAIDITKIWYVSRHVHTAVLN